MYKKILLIGSGNFIDKIKALLSNLALESETAEEYPGIRRAVNKKNADIILFEADHYSRHPLVLKKIFTLLSHAKTSFMVFSAKKNAAAVMQANAAGASDYILMPYNVRELNLRLDAAVNKKKRIVCIGGGTGLFNILMGIKNIPGILPISVVSMTDDGGSSGRLRDLFGVLPPGDVRRSLVALSSAPQIMNEIMTYRFKSGDCFTGHNFGNILLMVLNNVTGSMSEGVKALGDLLNVEGIVLPVSVTDSRLCAEFEDGTIVKGESNIDLGKGRPPGLRITRCWHEPHSRCDINSFSSITNADIVTIGPGDLYTSVITNLLICDIRRAIAGTKAKKIYICNIMTKPGETSGYTALDHIREIVKYLKKDCLDYVIISDNSALSKKALLRYSRKKQFPVRIGDISQVRKATKARIIIADIAHETELIRHDSRKIRDVISRIMKE